MPLTALLAAPGKTGCFHTTRPLNALRRCTWRFLPDSAVSEATRWQAGARIACGVGKRSLSSGAPPHLHHPKSDPLSHQDQPNSEATPSSDDPDQIRAQRTYSSHCIHDSALSPQFEAPPPPGRTVKRFRPSPGGYLLKVANHHTPNLYFTPPSHKVDLSYNSVRTLVDKWSFIPPGSTKRSPSADADRNLILADTQEEKGPSSLDELDWLRLQWNNPTEMSLQSILTEFIYKVGRHVVQGQTTSHTFSVAETLFLRSKGYDVGDVPVWASVVMNKNPDVAAQYFTLEETLPLFLILFFLKRRNVSVDALAMIIERLRSHDLRTRSLDPKSDRLIDPLSFSIVLIRLVRHARKKSPIDFPAIASLLTSQMEKAKGDFPKPGEETSNFVFFCNRFLSLLSMPASIQPYLSSRYQETAQFKVLQAMSDHDPPILVNQEGYRALARVQLAHAKTEQEREWALLKSKAWPPWKENRTAMDEDKGVDAGISRAVLTMQQMYAAGYPPRPWEVNATISAGWDTDGSPTIQDRHNMANVPLRIRTGKEPSYITHRFEIAQWAARVRATRTRREAWACFLAYERTDLPPHQNVYLAMFTKLQYRETPQARDTPGHSQSSSENGVFPGDGKESFPEPSSIHEITYISEPVPSYEELLNRMMSKNVNVSDRFLASLINGAPSERLGLPILKTFGSAYGGAIQRLLDGSVTNKADIEGIPEHLLVEILDFFCRVKYVPRYPQLIKNAAFNHDMSLNYFFQIVTTCQPDYRPMWTNLLRWVNVDGRWPNDWTFDSQDHRWRLMSRILKLHPALLQEPDEQSFQLVCERIGRTAISYYGYATPAEPKEELFAGYSQRIRSLFRSLIRFRPKKIGAGQVDEKHLMMTVVPGPSTLHAYIRTLGLISDFEGICSCASWMGHWHPILLTRADTQAKGRRRLREAVIAMRVFLERSWVAVEEQEKRVQAPTELIERVKGSIEGSPELGGWATDEEVHSYVERNPVIRGAHILTHVY
ncbi:uncharacterized protein BDZ99DRAFT_435832 [Mytilinidion resinicola]|uniref:Uncharacterized protein n=1 Tax=Mytilinidion resinicola TaxID=574789 RepID=A0A6A6Z2X7_9PEZI|nr:uncharacterized protein BDZ99DRAFT_435832 [Mytilinidion resinicola]KAF2815481.1 hypothetical protein BDZ99DRAFT_435832 [Mytilinidion resinicola]